MNDAIRMTIDSQRQYFYDTFIIDSPAVEAGINEYHSQLTAFGEPFTDVTEFSAAMTASPLMARFSELYMMCTKQCSPRDSSAVMPQTALGAADIKKEAGDLAASAAQEVIDSASHQMRYDAHSAAWNKIRDIPAAGEVLFHGRYDLGERIKGIFGKKDKNKDSDPEE